MRLMMIILALSTLIAGCGNKEQEEKLAKLKKEVMGIHDEVMPKMDDIIEQQDKLKKMMKEWESDSAKAEMEAELEEMKDQFRQLEEAHEVMMAWMRQYNIDAEVEMGMEKANSYYQNEKKRIEDVKQKMLSSIKEAEEWIEKHGEESPEE